jgi:hypothetical protein
MPKLPDTVPKELPFQSSTLGIELLMTVGNSVCSVQPRHKGKIMLCPRTGVVERAYWVDIVRVLGSVLGSQLGRQHISLYVNLQFLWHLPGPRMRVDHQSRRGTLQPIRVDWADEDRARQGRGALGRAVYVRAEPFRVGQDRAG